MRPELTILTDPVPYGRHFFVEPAKQIARRVRNIVSPRPRYKRSVKYRGHFAVTRSMVEGLQKIGVRSNYNPQRLAEVGEVVVVPAGFAALRRGLDGSVWVYPEVVGGHKPGGFSI